MTDTTSNVNNQADAVSISKSRFCLSAPPPSTPLSTSTALILLSAAPSYAQHLTNWCFFSPDAPRIEIEKPFNSYAALRRFVDETLENGPMDPNIRPAKIKPFDWEKKKRRASGKSMKCEVLVRPVRITKPVAIIKRKYSSHRVPGHSPYRNKGRKLDGKHLRDARLALILNNRHVVKYREERNGVARRTDLLADPTNYGSAPSGELLPSRPSWMSTPPSLPQPRDVTARHHKHQWLQHARWMKEQIPPQGYNRNKKSLAAYRGKDTYKVWCDSGGKLGSGSWLEKGCPKEIWRWKVRAIVRRRMQMAEREKRAGETRVEEKRRRSRRRGRRSGEAEGERKFEARS